MTPPTDTAPHDAPEARDGLLGRARAELRVFPRQFWLLSFGFFVLLSRHRHVLPVRDDATCTTVSASR